MKIACFDLETTNLSAGRGKLLTSSIFSYPENKMYTYKINHKRAYDDRTICKQTRDKLNEHNLLVGWYIKGFDLPFLNTRLKANGMNKLNRKFILDLIYYFRGWHGLKPGKSSLGAVARFFNLEEQKDRIPDEVWGDARGGKKKAIDRIAKRGESDVRLTWEIYWKIIDEYVGKLERYGQ